MRSSLVPLIALAAISAGCDGVFGLTTLNVQPDAAPDAPGACVDLRPFGATCRTIMPELLADTVLSSTTPDLAFGAKDAVRATRTDPALFKFDLSEVAVDERVAAAHLYVPFVASNGTALSCSSTGTSCAVCGASTYETSSLYWTTSNWSQSFATYVDADQGRAWTAPGASGMDERSELVTTGPPPTMGIDITVSQADVMNAKPECFVTSQQLSILVFVEGVAWIRQLGPQPCVTPKSATLELTVCRD